MSHDRVVLSFVGRRGPARSRALERARRLGYRNFAVGSGGGLEPRAEETWLRSLDRQFTSYGSSASSGHVPLREVRSAIDLASALRAGARFGAIAIRWMGPRIIPLESALSRRPGRCAIWVVTARPSDIPGALGALEVGADRVVVEVEGPESVDLVDGFVDMTGPSVLRWSLSVVSQIQPAGTSERVLVDTTSMLSALEGMLVGSSAGRLFHVVSEATGSSFSRPRPFRVNAGSPHLYLLMGDGTTRYLSELEGGDRVLVATPGGATRSVRVGRIKIERRPMVLIRVRGAGGESTVFLQEAETVRLTSSHGPIPVTELRVRDRLRVVALPRARHLGLAVEEHIEER